MKCNFIKANNEVCGNNAIGKDTKCYWHSKKISEDEKKKQRSKGGKSKILKVNSDFKEFELKTIADVLKLNSEMINRILRNELDLRIGTGITYMLNLHLKALEIKFNVPLTMKDIVIKLPPEFKNKNRDKTNDIIN